MYRSERIETHHHSSSGTASETPLAEATYTSGECYVELFAAFPVRKSNARIAPSHRESNLPDRFESCSGDLRESREHRRSLRLERRSRRDETTDWPAHVELARGLEPPTG